jgi:hypothetical protein
VGANEPTGTWFKEVAAFLGPAYLRNAFAEGSGHRSMATAGLDVMRKQYHFWPGDHGLDAWDVDRLIVLSRDFRTKRVPIESIWELDSNYWFDDSGQRPTVRRVVEHLRLMDEVDLSHPVILGPDGRVMDGMHRIARAVLEGHETILAVQFETLPEPDYRDCRADELPY